MDLLIAFIVFLVVMTWTLLTEYSMVIALLVGLFAFLAVGVKRGFSLEFLLKSSYGGIKESLIVIYVMCLIGIVTATWRMSGTITIFVYYGIKIITPSLFLIIAFLLSSLLSYALGTSFGVAGTVGVIFIALARSGGVDPVLTAGVLMSGIYFGDRGSPVSSSANLVAGVTKTKIYDNVRQMMKTARVPFVVTFLLYLIFSLMNPASHVDTQLMETFQNEFNLSLWAFIPALLMLVLPLLKINIMISLGASILSGIFVSWRVQGIELVETLKVAVLGYEANGNGLGRILNGGGLVSMGEIIIILIISGCYSGIFKETEMLKTVQGRLITLSNKYGRFSIMVLLSLGTSMVFCNQTIATLMCNNLMKPSYLDGNGSKEELAIDMENSVILVACIVPWCIGCTVPLAFFDVNISAMPYAFYMYLVPIFYFFTKKRWYSDK